MATEAPPRSSSSDQLFLGVGPLPPGPPAPGRPPAAATAADPTLEYGESSVDVAADAARWAELARAQAPTAPGPAAPPEAPAAPAAPTPTPATATEAKAEAAKPAGPKLRGRRRKARRKWDMPAWAVSALVHAAVLGALGAATFTPEIVQSVRDLSASMETNKSSGEPELLNIYADPSDAPRDMATGDTNSSTVGVSTGFGSGIAAGTPSATPSIGNGAGAAVGDRTSLPGIKVMPQLSGLAMLPSGAAVARDLGGGGMISGDVTYETKDVGVALDQLAREILRHLAQHKLTVVWLFDESESMKDDQQEIKKKFDRVASELKLNVEETKKSAGALNHAIVGFGSEIHYEMEKPTLDPDAIGKAIDRLRVDSGGAENTLHAVQDVIGHYGRLITKERRLLIVLVTDESGDDGGYIEEARQAAVSRNVPIYIIGRQSLFGYGDAHLRYVDPVTKDVYWPTIRRGPETADVEQLQYDGLHHRWDEQPSGFAPYELARLSKDTGGIYFALPSEESMRAHQREKAYSITVLKEYVPDYESRVDYLKRRESSEFRRTLHDIIELTRPFPFRIHFPVEPGPMIEAADEAGGVATERLNVLIPVEKRLRDLKKLRDREPDRRWQANYDLMLAQVVTYQIKAYEYRACLAEMIAKPPVPKTTPKPELMVRWEINHSHDRKAPAEKTEKVYVEAERLLKLVIERHPRTPWADLAQDEINRGFGAQRYEWVRSSRYDERAKLVPKY